MTTKENITRKTTIRIGSFENMVNFFNANGIQLRKMKTDQYQVFHGIKLSQYDNAAILVIEKMNKTDEINNINEWYVSNEYINDDIWFKFGLYGNISIDVSDYHGRITIETMNLTKPQHKKVVRSLYCPIKEMFPLEASYNCEVERTNSNCLN
jgi:hypothetical protein